MYTCYRVGKQHNVSANARWRMRIRHFSTSAYTNEDFKELEFLLDPCANFFSQSGVRNTDNLKTNENRNTILPLLVYELDFLLRLKLSESTVLLKATR